MIDKVAISLKSKMIELQKELKYDEKTGSNYYKKLAKAAIEAMLEPSEELKKFEIDDDLFDWDCTCNYCGGHKFAYQAVIKQALLDK